MTKHRRGQNEGSIFQRRDGRWCGILSLGRRAGKRARKSFYGATAAEVQEQMTKAKNDLRLGLPVASDRQALGDFLTDWLTNCVKPRVRPMTHQQYWDHIRLYLAPRIKPRIDLAVDSPKSQLQPYEPPPALGTIELTKLQPEHVQNFINAQLTKNRTPAVPSWRSPSRHAPFSSRS